MQQGEYCLSKRKATEDSPDGWNATCMRLNNKIFAILNHEEGEKAAITLKCDPELALRLRKSIQKQSFRVII